MTRKGILIYDQVERRAVGFEGRIQCTTVDRASAAGATDPAQNTALRMARSLHGTASDGQRYAVDRLADHATVPKGKARVQVSWTGYFDATCMDAADAPLETRRINLRRAARPPGAPSHLA